MRKKVAGIAMATGLLVGGGALAVVHAAPVLAQEVDVESTNPFQSFIQSLVDDQVITQEQADVISERAQEARTEHGPRARRGAKLDTAAEAIGFTPDELRDGLQAGSTIADIAAGNGVDPQAVIDALVADGQARIDQAVADGRLTPDEAAEKAADLETKATEAVNGEIDFSERGPRRWRGGPGFGPGSGSGGPLGTDA